MKLAFHVDTRYCSGCKSCQLACKDKNKLPVGQLWRRVYEITEGEWQPRGAAWTQNIKAYNVSISCNHCERCICIEVCPVKAYQRREDGVVTIDQSRCMGCGYCALACPYGAPQFNPELGRMGKCDFCQDRLEAGKPPVCVEACPMRIISYGDRDEMTVRLGPERQVFPLPSETLTEPNLLIRPHPDAAEIESPVPLLSNPEEV
jgi:anaerobic dimethyl sulfoxide reductase subunit B (iron-sulfur subunit)